MAPIALTLAASLTMAAVPSAGNATAPRLARKSPKQVLAARLSTQTAPPSTQFIVVETTPEPTDCGMVKRVDPNFKSKMPVATPDPKLMLPMKVVAVPSCDPHRR